jgi:anti-sigma regulatory factor (Ser/Thr protein kinase)
MADKMAIQVKNLFEEIPAANDAATNWLAVRAAPPAIDYLANLAIEELLTNCIKYGYQSTNHKKA